MIKKKNNFLENFLTESVSQLFKAIDRKLWKNLDHVFFISHESIRRAKEGNLISNNNYSIFNPGINWSKIKSPKKYSDYFFLPGRISWSKNIEVAILAFKTFKKSYTSRNFKLVIAGQVDRKSIKYFKYLKSLSKNDNSIKFIKNPSDKIMQNLYANCLATVATAFNEDWGLTPIEGNAHSKASLFINSGGYKESQVNNKTGIAYKNNPADLASKMLTMAKNKNYTIELGKQARIYSEKYSWKKIVKIFDKEISKLVMS